MSVDVLLVCTDPDLAPSYAHPGDAGADLRSAVDVTVSPGDRALVPTGVSIALPDGYAAFVVPRSGLAARHGIGLVNSPGTIDAGYRGEISVVLINHHPERPHAIARGDRIAQLVVTPVEQVTFHPVTSLPGSMRGAGAFGSSGR